MSRDFHGPKQFPDTMRALSAEQHVHLDAVKHFRPCFLDHIIDVIGHYVDNERTAQRVMNLGVTDITTYYDFVKDVAAAAGFDTRLVMADGDETTWPENSVLSIEYAKSIGYPSCSYDDAVEAIAGQLRRQMS